MAVIFNYVRIQCFRAIEGGATKSLSGGAAALDGGHGDPATTSIIGTMYDFFWLRSSTSPHLSSLLCSTLTELREYNTGFTAHPVCPNASHFAKPENTVADGGGDLCCVNLRL